MIESGRAPSRAQWESLRKTKPPVTSLGKLPSEEVPDYLDSLSWIARCILGMALYDDLEVDLKCAEWVISFVEEQLAQAKKEVQEARAQQGGGPK